MGPDTARRRPASHPPRAPPAPRRRRTVDAQHDDAVVDGIGHRTDLRHLDAGERDARHLAGRDAEPRSARADRIRSRAARAASASAGRSRTWPSGPSSPIPRRASATSPSNSGSRSRSTLTPRPMAAISRSWFSASTAGANAPSPRLDSRPAKLCATPKSTTSAAAVRGIHSGSVGTPVPSAKALRAPSPAMSALKGRSRRGARRPQPR